MSSTCFEHDMFIIRETMYKMVLLLMNIWCSKHVEDSEESN